MSTKFSMIAASITTMLVLTHGAIASIAKAEPTVNCTVPNSVSCNISSSKGIRSVRIQANTPLGTIDLVNKSYSNCPTSVTVGWDSAYQSSSQKIVECSSVGGSGKPGKLKN
ncbi:hypothetical protein H6G04_12295 [Calothrix membranacea FACHB-236]|nr:hypothetical protein [Calothrix membranacea FACHB-236]